jgi:hypothetical protein
VRDRVAQMAAKIMIEPIFEADFEASSFGFRPKKSAVQALEAILHPDDYVHMRLERWLSRRGGQRRAQDVHRLAGQFGVMGLYRLRGTVRYAAQAASIRSSLSRVRENRTHGLKGVC